MGSQDTPTYSRAFGVADHTAAWAQRTHLRLTRAELGLLVLAAAAGAVPGPVGPRGVDLAGVAAVVLFSTTLVLRGYRTSVRPTTVWQDARAAAESIKTLCWRYAVGSRLFPADLDGAAADRLFVERLREILASIRDLQAVEPEDHQYEEVTQWMRRLRAAPLAERRSAYERQRIEDQQHWYAGRARSNRRRAQRWNVAVLTLELLGVVVGVVKAFSLAGTDDDTAGLLGLVATVGAAAAAWVQTKQYAALASAYAIANEELAAIRVLIPYAATEQQWAEFVDSAEAAISREHTMWRASRTS
ncbi:DUF4231 domain-containing protein [Geodermatophilus sp. SYSU D00708]